MKKAILITGSTDGIGREAAKLLVSKGHQVLLHGRNPSKLAAVEEELSSLAGEQQTESYLADLSRMAEVEALAKAVSERHTHLDVLINNAGVFHPRNQVTDEGLDTRFAVNTIAPYLLTQRLLPLMDASGRVVNLSSAAQSPVDPKAIAGGASLPDGVAYAQSKLALTMWSEGMARSLGDEGPVIVAVNPGSLLATKMVKQAFGVNGADIQIGAGILCKAALSDEFENASGQYFDNDAGRFSSPHPDARTPGKIEEVMRVIEAVIAEDASSRSNA